MTALLLFLATISLLFEATTQTAIASGPTPTPLPPASQHRQWSPDAPQRARNANGVLRVPSDYPTITQALSDAQAGDTVRVAGGSYLEGALAVPPGVHLVGDGWRNTIIDGGGADVVVYPGPGSLVEGFTIQGSGDGYFNAGVWISRGEAIIRKNHIRDNATGFWAWCFDPASCAVQATIERNVISGNAFNGINSNDQPRLIIRRNTIVENDAAGGILNNAASLAKNNLIVANAGEGLVNHAGASAGYNNVWGNAQDFVGVAPGPGNLSLDPLFRNAAQGDYRLRAASPVIGMAEHQSPLHFLR